MSTPTGAERYLAGRLEDPEYRAAYDTIVENWVPSMARLQASFVEENPFTETAVSLQLWCGKYELTVLLAETLQQKALGMTGRTFEAGQDGMLFVEAADSNQKFHMVGVPTALVIAWFDADGDYIDHQIMPRATGWQYEAQRPYRYALELPDSWIDRAEDLVGSKLHLA